MPTKNAVDFSTNTATPNSEDKEYWLSEYLLCKDDNVPKAQQIGFLYFIETYCKVMDVDSNAWVSFLLWRGQRKAIRQIHNGNKVIILKARQIGLTWLLIAYALWMMIFIPNSVVLFWSKRDDEATDLIENRLYKMWELLPPQLQPKILVKNSHEIIFANGSRAQAFPTTAGDSYTANLAVMDEFDLVDNQAELLGMVEPVVGDTGKLVLISRVDKNKPKSVFKEMWRNDHTFTKIFLAWNERPDRDQKWYEAKVAASLAKDGSLDSVYEQYPSTPDEALSGKVQGKAIPYLWLKQCYQELTHYDEMVLRELAPLAPALNGLRIFRLPIPGRNYVMGADTAEGNVNSDDSALSVWDKDYREEVAVLQGKFTPEIFGSHISLVSAFFNHAPALVENNNHGYAVLMFLREMDGRKVKLFEGHDGKDGWSSNTIGKSVMYARAQKVLRNGQATLHDQATYTQLTTIEGSTLKAPKNMPDDLAVAAVLGMVALELKLKTWNTAASASEKSQDRDKMMEKRLRNRRR